MKKILISIVAVVVAVVTAQAGPVSNKIVIPAEEAINCYVAFAGGMNANQTGMGSGKKIGWDLNVKLGYNFSQLDCAAVTPAIELEEIYSRFNRKGGLKTFAWSTMLNALAKYDLGCGWQPYAGFGLGWYYMRAKAGDDKASKNGFAWQLIGGIDYAIDANWSLFAEYKWLNYQIRKHEDFSSKSRIGNNLVNLGVRYNF